MKRFKVINIITLSFLIFFGTGMSLEWQSLVPSAREFATLNVDSVNQRIIMFGGGSYRLTGRWTNDVWEMPLNNDGNYFWLPVSVSGTRPQPRGGHLAVYVPNPHPRIIVFGGDVGWGNRVNDLWALNLTSGNESWERLNPLGTIPSARSVCVGIYHPTRNSIMVFGGDGNYGVLDDLWELRLDSLIWREISTTGPKPLARGGGFGAFFCQGANKMVIFGGLGAQGFLNDLWALDLTPGQERWTQLFPSGNIPSPRSVFACAYSSRLNKFYIYGGWNDYGHLGDLWVLNIPSLSWTQLFPTGEGPGERRKMTGVYDLFNNNIIIFGGNLYPDYYFSETFLLNLDSGGLGEWKEVSNLLGPYLLVNSPAINSCNIRFIIPKLQEVKMQIIDATGRVIKNLYSGYPSSNSFSLLWNGTDETGQKVNSGTYFCELETETERIAKKFVLTR